MENTSPLTLVVPEHILGPLFVSANCAKLDQALENLKETAKTPDGRLKLSSVKILPIVLDLTRSQIFSSNHYILLLSFKLLRDLCAGEILNQNCFIEEDGVNVVARALDLINFDANSSDEIIEIIRFGLELLGNVCGAGEEHQAAVWSQLFPVVFKDIAGLRVKKTSDVLSMVIYSCCHGSSEIMRQLCEVPGLRIVAEIVRTASRDGLEEDWLLGLLAKICLEEAYFSPLFFMLSTTGAHEQNNNLKETGDIFTLENGFLLSILFGSLNKKRDENVSKEFALSILGILKRVVTVVNFFSRGQSTLPTGAPAVDILGIQLTF
ncbi:ataxin-10-like [Papaver somniferum]|uniref:ataxin-10-like n=1 Tax=Papaver somniferum TaxID=3469 RepID=UPI000E6F4BBE|nr:ataxin-10-like [Papaver somniferum]